MADGYLESHYEAYEKRKAAWLKTKKKSAAVPRDVKDPWNDR